MTKSLRTLIIEEHPPLVEVYMKVLDHIASENGALEFRIATAKNYDTANQEIEYAVDHYIIDLVFLDMSLPASQDRKLFSGDDLGLKLRSLFPKVKIIVTTHLDNNYWLINILKMVKPDGLILKNELTFQGLTNGVLNVLNGIPFYSNPVLKLIRQHISNDFNLDDIDRKILYHLSLGTKTKELPEMVDLSLSGIESRKRRLNQIFNNEKKTNKALLKLAKENGFL